MTVGTKTHYCDRRSGELRSKTFGRIVNLYVHQDGKWKKIGKICSNCGDHWINDVAYEVPRPNNGKAGKS